MKKMTRYNKTNWVDNKTIINAEHMNNIESGIENASISIEKIESTIVDLQNSNKSIKSEIDTAKQSIQTTKSNVDLVKQDIEKIENNVANLKASGARLVYGEDGTKYSWGVDEIGIYLESVDVVPEEEIGMLSLGDNTKATYFAEYDGQIKSIDNAVNTDEQLVEGKYSFEIL